MGREWHEEAEWIHGQDSVREQMGITPAGIVSETEAWDSIVTGEGRQPIKSPVDRH